MPGRRVPRSPLCLCRCSTCLFVAAAVAAPMLQADAAHVHRSTAGQPCGSTYASSCLPSMCSLAASCVCSSSLLVGLWVRWRVPSAMGGGSKGRPTPFGGGVASWEGMRASGDATPRADSAKDEETKGGGHARTVADIQVACSAISDVQLSEVEWQSGEDK
jgi:hypothetical protein